MLEDLASEFDERVDVYKIDIDHAQEAAAKYRLRSVPTLLFLREGDVKDQLVVALPKSKLKEHFEALVA